MIEKIMQLAKGFAGLSGMELLAYASRCGVKLEDDPADQPGICPLCGGKLDYGGDASANRPHAVGWTCESCGAAGKEAYREVFDCHYDVQNRDGELIVGRDQNK